MQVKKFVVIGHVDTGKSCLCGHLLYKCGFISDHEMNKIREQAKRDKMEKWVWSRVLDIYEEEMLKGKTHEFNSIEFKYNNKDYQLIDTPGHQIFIRSMIEGISQEVDICVLLVSMIPNEFESSFEKGMLKEHLLLARSIGIKNLIVIGNKMDAIKWEKKVYDNHIDKVTKFLKNIHWDKKNCHYIPISAFGGIGIDDTKDIPDWYTGKSFLETLETIKPKIKDHSATEVEYYCDSVIADLKLFNVKDIIVTNGFIMNCHYSGSEVECSIKKIKDKNIIKNAEVASCILKFSQKINVYKNMKLIFRKEDKTLGCGKIIKISLKVKN